MTTAHTPGPVETLARLAIQSERYVRDEEFQIAVDALIGQPVFDTAPELLEACRLFVAYEAAADDGDGVAMMLGYNAAHDAIRAAIAKATGGAA